jgi:hypothetical protein
MWRRASATLDLPSQNASVTVAWSDIVFGASKEPGLRAAAT